MNLELVDTTDFTDNYYKGGLQRAYADVYEIDTILLTDIVDAGKIQPTELPDRAFLPEAINAVEIGGRTYAVPHWVCGNFLFYRKSDQAIANATTWPALLEAVTQAGKPLLVDLKGSSGLGEWYLSGLADRLGMERAQESIVRGDPLNASIVSTLTGLAGACPAGFCRDNNLHDRTGFYARVFLRGQHAGTALRSSGRHRQLQGRR